MAEATEDTSWLEIDAPVDDEGWLRVEDPNAGQVTLPFRSLIDSCMRGTDRVMACDGHYLAYRPFNREFDKETNPRTKERMAMFLEKGFYEHKGTYDEVQIYELLEGNPYRQTRNYVVGQDRWRDIRSAATAACERKWADYHDILGGMATAFKLGRDKTLAKAMWEDTLNQVAITILQMKGPTEREVNEGFTGVRQSRGISAGGVLIAPPKDMLINSSGLQKVGFDGKK